MSNRIRLRRRTLVRRGLPLALGGLLVTGTSVAWATAGSDGPAYRTAEAGLGSVDQVLVRTGTVEEVLQAAASFPVGGTVSSVAVAIGDEVDEGDVLAKLDRADLKAAVNAAKATLAKAEATLESDESGGSSAGSSGSSGSGSSSSGSTSSASSSSGSSSSGSSAGGTGSGAPGGAGAGVGGAAGQAIDFTREVAAVNAAQQVATAAAATADAALAAQRAACGPFTGTDAEAAAAALVHTSPSAAEATSAEDGEETDDDPTAELPPTTTVDTAPLIACITAVDATAKAQTALGTAQNALAQQDAALAAAMDRAVATLTAAHAAAQATAAAAAAAATQAASDAAKSAAEKAAAEKAAAEKAAASAASAGARSGGSTVSDAARIAVDEAAIRAAEAELAAAEDDYDGAVLRAPIDGVVGALPFTKGGSASSSDVATILGQDGVRVTVDVPLSAVTALKIGTPATVSSDGATEGSAGRVESVGLLPTGTSGTATYPVAVYVAELAATLTEGSAATVALALKSVTDVVTVPNSALSSTGTGSTGYVTLLENGKAVRRTVTFGAVGSATTEIVSGLEKGATVVLADRSQSVPASSTSSTRTFGGGNTFVPGGAQFGGGNVVRRGN